MKIFLSFLLTFFTVFTHAADVKISALPLGSAATTTINDSFPYVSTALNVTKRLTIWDLINTPTMVSTYASKANPTFTGTVTAPTFVGALTGNASTSTALAANPTDCGSNTYATTIAANGNLTCAAITNAATSGVSTNTINTLVLRDGSGNFSAGTVSAALTGNASTSTALASDPTDCSSNNYATAIAANGNLTCAQVSLTAGVTGTLPIANGGTNSTATATAGGVDYGTGTAHAFTSAGTAGQVLISAGASAPAFGDLPTSGQQITNLGLTTSVAASALTITLKQADGSTNPAAGTGAVKVGFWDGPGTSNVGSYHLRSITGALSITVVSGATLGQADNKNTIIYVYLVDSGPGTPVLAVSGIQWSENSQVTTTSMTTGSDLNSIIYSTSIATGSIRMIGKILNSQTTAGTWTDAGIVNIGNYASLTAVPSGYPTQQKFTSSSGTYFTPYGVKWIRVRMVGGGGGGGASGTSAGGSSGGGINTTFGSSLLTAGAGAGAGNVSGASIGGAGGTFTINAPAFGTGQAGGTGGSGSYNVSAGILIQSGSGGGSGLGATVGGVYNNNGNAGTLYGGGGSGGGGGATALLYSGGGGGGGGFIDSIITQPLSSYAYAVGSGGSGATAGGSGYAGGAGGAGYIEVTEYYQ